MKTLTLRTRTRTDFLNITADVSAAASELGITDGVLTVFVPHTTCGVTIQEQADPDVLRDLETALERMVPWTGGYEHSEGNAAAHVKASLMGASVQVVVEKGNLRLGTWQGIFLCEFDGPRSRQVWIAECGLRNAD